MPVHKRGFFRPGALQMAIAVALTMAGAIGPLLYSLSTPGHEWTYYVTGFPAFLLSISGLLIFALYAIGFLRYCVSKGYSKWLGLLLLFGNVFGFVVMLLLPDRNAGAGHDLTSTPQESSNR